jgi:hypothetical protein
MIDRWINSSVDVQPNLDELRAIVRRLDPPTRREASQSLIAQLRASWRYTGAHSWNRLVCICEALAEVGWGEMERMDAVCLYGGDGWDTRLINNRREQRLLWGWWGKRKAGWRLLTSRIYASPGFPDAMATDYVRLTAPYNDEKAQRLFTQRNYQRQRPVGLILYCGTNKVSEITSAWLRVLELAMRETARPDLYGEPLEHLYVSIHCPVSEDELNPRLEIGAFNVRLRSFYSKLYISSDFGKLSIPEQWDYLRTQIHKAIDAAEAKLNKRKLPYRFDLLREDTKKAFAMISPPAK